MSDDRQELQCEICGCIFSISKWAKGNCTECGQEYEYDENYVIRLSNKQILALKTK